MTCPALIAPGGQAGLATMLRGVDCMTGQATALGFSRLLGSHGALTGALTLLLTLYIAFLAIGLITGRASLSLSSLTPRMMALGMALTFATSWMAYSQTIWTLLSAGPDWLASQILGLRGSASLVLAGRLDAIFAALLDAAAQAQAAQGDAKGIQPSDLLQLSAMILMLGSVGVMVTSRIVLAVLLALGPVFVVLSLFSGTRGLFEGWLKAAVGFALVPLFTVLVGAGAVGVLAPMLSAIGQDGITLEEAAAVLMAAIIHAVLMVMAMRVTAMLTSGWRIGSMAQPAPAQALAAMLRPATAIPMMQGPGITTPTTTTPTRDRRIQAILAATTHHLATPASPGRPQAGHAAPPATIPAVTTTNRSRQLARQIGQSSSRKPLP